MARPRIQLKVRWCCASRLWPLWLVAAAYRTVCGRRFCARGLVWRACMPDIVAMQARETYLLARATGPPQREDECTALNAAGQNACISPENCQRGRWPGAGGLQLPTCPRPALGSHAAGPRVVAAGCSSAKRGNRHICSDHLSAPASYLPPTSRPATILIADRSPTRLPVSSQSCHPPFGHRRGLADPNAGH